MKQVSAISKKYYVLFRDINIVNDIVLKFLIIKPMMNKNK